MTKQEFIIKLTLELHGLPKADIEERVGFYSEMIDDRIEAGLSEEEAVADIGSVEDVVAQILSEIPLGKLVKEKIKPKRRFTWWEITLIAVGSPIWLSLLISAFAVVISLYATIWALIASLWAVGASLAGGALGGITLAVLMFTESRVVSGIAILGAAFVCAGLSIPLFFACRKATVGAAKLAKTIVLSTKRLFIRKEDKK